MKAYVLENSKVIQTSLIVEQEEGLGLAVVSVPISAQQVVHPEPKRSFFDKLTGKKPPPPPAAKMVHEGLHLDIIREDIMETDETGGRLIIDIVQESETKHQGHTERFGIYALSMERRDEDAITRTYHGKGFEISFQRRLLLICMINHEFDDGRPPLREFLPASPDLISKMFGFDLF